MSQAQDISAQLGMEIGESTGGGGKPFIRHGKYYELLITRCHAKSVKMEDTKWHRFAFMEFKVLKSEPHPPGTIPTSLQSKDDGTNPNPVGSLCSHSIDFDGNGAPMAGQNVKEFIAGLFGMNVDELSKEDAMQTWIDLSRKQDVKVGGVDYIDPKTNQPVLAKKDKIANMGCGFIIGLSTQAKELKETRKVKDLPQEQRKYFTQKLWMCLAKPGMGVNAPDEVAKRRSQTLLEVPMDDEEDGETPPQQQQTAAPPATQTVSTTQVNGAAAAGGAPTPPVAPAPPAPPTPPPAVDPNWPPQKPWEGVNDGNKSWMKPGFVWSNPANGGTNAILPEAEYRAGKRAL